MKAPMKEMMRLNLLSALAFVGFVLAAMLTSHYYDLRGGTAAFKSFCNMSAGMNCDVVAVSSWAELAGGLPLSGFAAGWYIALLVVSLIARNPFWRREAVRATFAITAIGLAFSAFYLYVMAAKLHTYCLQCLLVDGVNLVAFGLALSLKPEGFKQHKPEKAKWKTLGLVTGGSLLAAVLFLKMSDPLEASSAQMEDLAQGVLQTAPVSVASGPEMPSIGPADAPITIVEFSDFQCPYCRLGAKTVHSLMSRYPGKIRLVYRGFPLDPACNRFVQSRGHPVSCEATRAAICAHKQGKFDAMYGAIFERQSELAPGKPEEFAGEVGVSLDQLKGCMGMPETGAMVSKNIEDGNTLGVQSTPTFYINGRRVQGALPLPVWSRVVDRLLADARAESK
jgi:protein-disulfide isomerase